MGIERGLYVQSLNQKNFAPCTNYATCPIYTITGRTTSHKDRCHVSQCFLHPTYLQRILGASQHNHEDNCFSYLYEVSANEIFLTKPRNKAFESLLPQKICRN